MNIFAILNHMGVFFKEEPVRQLHHALEKAGYDVVYPVDDKDLIKMIEMNPRICGVLFDWDKYSLELCERISQINEKLPVHAFANEQSTLDISLTDLRLMKTILLWLSIPIGKDWRTGSCPIKRSFHRNMCPHS